MNFERIRRTVVLVFFLLINHAVADWLWVQDPRGWRSGQGTIEEAIVAVYPRGLYTEIGLYLTFSARGLDFTNVDTLESTLYFTLPPNTIVHDSWLWIGDEIVQAKLLDQWTASQIYEDIVNRRRDPSVLFKRSQTDYELRIYPMPGNEKRKVKITFLVPAQWTTHDVVSSLPVSILQSSLYPIRTLYLLAWIGGEWKHPSLLECPDVPFIEHSDQRFGHYLRADIPVDAVNGSLHFSLDAPYQNGVYLNRVPSKRGNVYQLALLPSKALNLTKTPLKKAALLFDYVISNSTVTESEILQTVKSLLHTYFSPSDSFNIFISQLRTRILSGSWLPADSSTIENAFTELGRNPLAGYSNLPTLLSDGIEFVKQHGNDGSVILLSNSGQAGDYQSANRLIDDLLKLMHPTLPIHVGDFQNQNVQYYYIGSRYYYGNDYLYQNLTRMTAGNYQNLYSSGLSFGAFMSSLFGSLDGFMKAFDLSTGLVDGFCYGRFGGVTSGQTVYLSRPILQVGKYNGRFPFVVQAAGEYKSEVFSQRMEISEENAFNADSLSEEIWAGNCLQSLESGAQTNDVVNEAIGLSMEERILSQYTAFLCLEPRMGGRIMSNPWDESSLVSAVRGNPFPAEGDSIFQAYPNPFNAQTTISVRLKDASQAKDVSFKIFNLLGQVIRSFQVPEGKTAGTFRFVWDGTDEFGLPVSSGSYFFMMVSPVKRQTLKLLYLK